MKNKIIYICIIFFTIVLYLFFETDTVSFLLAYELTAASVFYLMAALAGRRVNAKITVPYHAQKNEEFGVDIDLENKSVFPLPSVKVRFQCVNEFTGEIFKAENTAMLDAKSSAVLRFYLQAGCCGKQRLRIERIWVQDYLRLFWIEVKKSEKTADELMVLPVFHKINLYNAAKANSRYELEQYSHLHSGEDTSEVFDVHQFRPGDTLQRMHWKLTAKTNEYLVKEFSLPTEHTIFLFLDLYYEKSYEFTQEKLDCFLEVLASLSWSMEEQGFSHVVVWYDAEKSKLREILVEKEKDVYLMLDKVCNGKIYEEYVDIKMLYQHEQGQIQGKDGLLLDINGRLYRNDVCVKQFEQDDIEKELMEWKPEI